MQSQLAANHTIPDKAALVRRGSSIKTVLPAAIAKDNVPIMPPPTPELEVAQPPMPISNTSNKPALRTSTGHPSAQIITKTASSQDKGWVEAQYDFTAEMSGEISISKGDIIKVTEKLDEGWWQGECNGRSGLFPANYVKEVSKSGISSRRSSISRQHSKTTLSLDDVEVTTGTSVVTHSTCSQCVCAEFAPNVFKPGKCNNCFHQH